MSACPARDVEHDATVAAFNVSKHSYIAARPGVSFGYIATSSLVLDLSIEVGPRILLLQRAAGDEDAHKWEPPGGACDDDDPSILYGAARELWEESGLQAVRILDQIGTPYFFSIGSGKQVCQFNFLVRVRDHDGIMPVVRLNPKEHQRYIWATKDEVLARQTADVGLDFTRDEVFRTVLLALDQNTRK